MNGLNLLNRKNFVLALRIAEAAGSEKGASGYDAAVKGSARSILGSALVAMALTPGLVAAESGAFRFLLAGALGADGELELALESYAEAVRAAPTDPYVRLAYAEILAQTGKIAEAAQEAAAARRLAPDEPEVFRSQARIAMSLADRDLAARGVAREAFERLIEHEPGDLEALVALGQLYLGGSEAARAVEVLSRAASLRPGQPTIEGLRARALVAAGKLKEAETVQRTLLESHPNRLEFRFELADTVSDLGRYREAAEILGAASAEQLRSPELRRRGAVALMLEGDLEGARALADELQAEYPENSALRVLLGSIEHADGRWERVLDLIGPIATRPAAPEAVASMQLRALEGLERIDEALAFLDLRRDGFEGAGRKSDATSTAILAAEIAARSGRAADATRRVEALAAAESANAGDASVVRDNVAWLYAELALARQDWKSAASALGGLDFPAALAKRYEIAVRGGDASAAATLRRRLEVGKAEELLALADVEERLELFESSIPIFRRVLELNGASLQARFGLASALERAGRGAESEREFENLLAAHPDHAASLNYLGYMWIDASRNLERAVELVGRAVRLDPANPAYVDSLGWGLFRLGRPVEAVRLLERAVRLAPDDATILEHLGDACVSAGDLKRAREAYERALALAGDAPALSAKLARTGRGSGAS